MANWTPLPKTETGRVDKKKIRELYDASEFVEWSSFARSKGYCLKTCYQRLKPIEWVNEKKQRIISAARDQISDFTLCHKGRWIDQIKSTLEQYPMVVDAIMSMVAQVLKERQNLKTTMSAKEISQLASTVKACVETKKSLLFLNQITVDVTNTIPKETSEEAKEHEWKLTVRGTEGMTVHEITKLAFSYLDKPKTEEQAEDELENA